MSADHAWDLKVTIISAKGLRNADWSIIGSGKSDPYCLCTVEGESTERFRTDTVNDNLNPEWNLSVELTDYVADKSLIFTVKDKDITFDDTLGTATLQSDRFIPHGCNAIELQLADPKQKASSTLSVKVEVLRQKPLGSKLGDSVGATPGVTETYALQLIIDSASGLRDADWGGRDKSDPYCTVEVEGQDGIRIRTRVIKDTLEPKWQHKEKLIDYVTGKSLLFTVWDKDMISDDLLGTCTLTSDKFMPNGCGLLELSLDDPKEPERQAYLKVSIQVLEATNYVHTDGGDPTQIQQESLNLAVMVRPDSGQPSHPEAIWNRVIEGATLPGRPESWDASVHGAVLAAIRGDATLCTYLAARCYHDAAVVPQEPGVESASGGTASIEGLSVLSKLDEHSRNLLWVHGVEPCVIVIPPGCEKINIKVDGHDQPKLFRTDEILESRLRQNNTVKVKTKNGFATGVLADGYCASAEHFSVGSTVELSQLLWPERKVWKLKLDQDELIELRRFLPDREGTAPSWQDCTERLWAALFPEGDRRTDRGGRFHDVTRRALEKSRCMASAPGGQFHVLAYPLAGDFTRLLVRPVRPPVTEANAPWKPAGAVIAQWPLVQHQIQTLGQLLQEVGETVLSQCAKSGHWDLVQFFLEKGVPCPNLKEEFADLCGEYPPARRQWSRDLSLAGVPMMRSLPHMALIAGGNNSLRAVLKALEEQGDMHEVDCTSLLTMAAEHGQWEALSYLLEEAEGGAAMVSVAPILELPVLSRAPKDVIEGVQNQAHEEKMWGTRALSLREYFERQLSGEIVSDKIVPNGFQLVGSDEVVKRGPHVVKLLNQAVRYYVPNNVNTTEIVYVSVSRDVFEEAKQRLSRLRSSDAESGLAMLPADLNEKPVCRREPRKAGLWLAVACPPVYLKTRAEQPVIHVPTRAFPAPYIPQATVRVSVRTPCCEVPVEQALVHVNGKRVGTTDRAGELRLALPPGRHTVTAPGQATEAKVVEVRRCSALEEVTLHIRPDLYFYLHDMTPDMGENEEVVREQYYVMLIASQFGVPVEAKSFAGSVRMSGREGTGASRAPLQFKTPRPLLTVEVGQRNAQPRWRNVTSGTGNGVDDAPSASSSASLCSAGLGKAPSCIRDFSPGSGLTKCGEQLLTLHVEPYQVDGARYEPEPEAMEWFDFMSRVGDDSSSKEIGFNCIIASLFTSPRKLGTLYGPTPARASASLGGNLRATASQVLPQYRRPRTDQGYMSHLFSPCTRTAIMRVSSPGARPASAGARPAGAGARSASAAGRAHEARTDSDHQPGLLRCRPSSAGTVRRRSNARRVNRSPPRRGLDGEAKALCRNVVAHGRAAGLRNRTLQRIYNPYSVEVT